MILDRVLGLIEKAVNEKLNNKIQDLRLAGLVFIDGFIQDTSGSNLIPGNVYYVESTKKLYLPQENSAAITKDPDSNTLYVKLPDHSIMYWDGTDLVNEGKLSSRKINSIEEIL